MRIYSRKMKTASCSKSFEVFDFKPDELSIFDFRNRSNLENVRTAIDKYTFLKTGVHKFAKKSVAKSAEESPGDFRFDDLEEILSLRSGEKDTAKNVATPSFEDPYYQTRKRKKSSAPPVNADELVKAMKDRHANDVAALREYFEDLLTAQGRNLSEQFDATLESKEKTIRKLTKENEDLEEALTSAEFIACERETRAIEKAKTSASRAVLMARLKMAEEALAHSFTLPGWDVAGWKKTLYGFQGECYIECEKIGTSGTKNQDRFSGEDAAH